MFLGMKMHPAVPEGFAEAASFMTDYERQRMWEAALLMADSRGFLMRVTAVFGRRIEALRSRVSKAGDRFGGEAWGAITRRAQDAVEDVLWNSFDFASAGLMAVPMPLRPKTARGNLAHRMAATASGVASGFVGLPGVLVDIPFTTMTILRSIAEVARDSGEDLAAEGTKRACLEVLAFGGPSAADDETEIGYWATRVGMNHFTVNMLIKAAAGRFGVVLSEKFMAQAVPVAGAVAGAALNYSFTDYYQKMARVHFTLRALEMRTGAPAEVKAVFAEMVGAARDRRRVFRRGAKEGVVYLPR
jgi:uncharacterized protein (DUF697 family)